MPHEKFLGSAGLRARVWSLSGRPPHEPGLRRLPYKQLPERAMADSRVYTGLRGLSRVRLRAG